MSKPKIFTIGFVIPGSDQTEAVEISERRSLLDADVVLFKPQLGFFQHVKEHSGLPVVDDRWAREVRERLSHWRREIESYASTRRLLIFLLSAPERVYVKENSRDAFSPKLTLCTSYDVLGSGRGDQTVRHGTRMSLLRTERGFSTFWHAVAATSAYEMTRSKVGGGETALVTAAGTKEVVAWSATIGRPPPSVFFVPPFDKWGDENHIAGGYVDEDGYVEYDDDEPLEWTPEARKLAGKILGGIEALRRSLVAEREPPPPWVSDAEFRTSDEERLENQIAQLRTQMDELRAEAETHQLALAAEIATKQLLYAQGSDLEEAVRNLFRDLGFVVEQVNDGESEFDAVLVDPEGRRFIVEVEGRDKGAIKIEKLSQLERNIQEDFHRDEVQSYAQGILVGNPERKTHPKARTVDFTPKVLSGAKRSGVRLVLAADLFRLKQDLERLDETERDAFRDSCRRALADGAGRLVGFPAPGLSTTVGGD